MDRTKVARRDQKLPKLEGSIRPEVADWIGPGQIGSGIPGEADRKWFKTRSGLKKKWSKTENSLKLEVVQNPMWFITGSDPNRKWSKLEVPQNRKWPKPEVSQNRIWSKTGSV